MKIEDRKLLKDFFRSLREGKVDSADSPYYVNYLQQDPLRDPIAKIATSIDLQEAAGVHLLTGQRGTGKSTELLRLKSLLEKNGCIVFLCDAFEYINTNMPVEISDFLISTMGALSEQAEQAFDKDFTHETYWTRVTKFLNTEVKVEEATITAGIADIKTSLHQDLSFKRQLQEQLRGRIGKLIKNAHDFADELVSWIRKERKNPELKVVLLFDSMDKMRGAGPDAAMVHDSIRNLFNVHGEALNFNLLHVLYMVPPYLTTLLPTAAIRVGGEFVGFIAGPHLFNRDGSIDEDGFSVIKDILSRRCSDWKKVISEHQLRDIACNIGGADLRELFRVIRGVIVAILNSELAGRAEIQATDAEIDSVLQAARRELLPIAESDKLWLRQIHTTKRVNLPEESQLPRLVHFFDANLVCQYVNDKDWYDVHPLIRDAIGHEPAE